MSATELVAGAALKSLFSAAVQSGGTWVRAHGSHISIATKCLLRLHGTRIRVSFSELLHLREGGRYLLVRNVKRPQQFGPLGGVVRYFEGSSEDRDIYWKYNFSPETATEPQRFDLRGYTDGKHLPSLLRWYEQGGTRERDTLVRELKEELEECSLPASPGSLLFKRVRVVHEGPRFVERGGHYQYRHFTILQPDVEHLETVNYFRHLVPQLSKHAEFRFATSKEIHNGRMEDGSLLGNHCCYLLGHRRFGDDPPLFKPG